MSSIPARCVCVVGEDCPVCPRQVRLPPGRNLSVCKYATPEDCIRTLGDRLCVLLVVSLDGAPEAGLQLLRKSCRACPLAHRIALVGKGDVPLTVNAMKAGAHECVEKPLREDWWPAAIHAAMGRWDDAHSCRNGALTEVEQFVWSQVVTGRTSKEIAAMLHRSLRTIEVHRTHILRKLGVSSTIDLVRQGMMTGLPDSAQPPEPNPRPKSESCTNIRL